MMKLRTVTLLSLAVVGLVLGGCSGSTAEEVIGDGSIESPATATPTTISADGTGPAATAVTSTAVGLTVLCSLDQDAARISCLPGGVPDDSLSELEWDSNISDRKTGPSYEVLIDEWIPAVVVTLELCHGSICEQTEAYIDTAWVNLREGTNGTPSVPPTPTRPNDTAPTATALTPVTIDSLTCDDDQITALYRTTCRAKLSGQVDWVSWKLDKGDKGWNREVDAEDALEEILVQRVTRSDVGDYVVEFEACTGGGNWYPSAECVEAIVTIQVIAGARWANGLPCESNTNPLFARWIMDEGQTEEIWATGVGAHSGTSQHSYAYPRYELEPAGVPVYVPVDSYLWQAQVGLIYSNGVKDYSLVLMVSCEVWIKFGHVVNPDQRIVDLVDSFSDENGHGSWTAKPALKYVNERIDPVFLEAGEVLFRHLPNRPGTNQGFDYGVFDGTHTNEYLNPLRWEKVDTFLHARCPYAFQIEPARSQIIDLLLPYQSTGDTCLGVNREVVGTLAGMWHFADQIAPAMEGHTLRFGGDLVFVEYFDGLIHVAGLNSKESDGLDGRAAQERFILRLAPGEGTHVLPQEITTSHCYEGYNLLAANHPNNFGYMFLYVEIVDDLTIQVAFADGRCPTSLPKDYITYIR